MILGLLYSAYDPLPLLPAGRGGRVGASGRAGERAVGGWHAAHALAHDAIVHTRTLLPHRTQPRLLAVSDEKSKEKKKRGCPCRAMKQQTYLDASRARHLRSIGRDLPQPRTGRIMLNVVSGATAPEDTHVEAIFVISAAGAPRV